jgi:hypothetical protein
MFKTIKYDSLNKNNLHPNTLINDELFVLNSKEKV